MTVNRAWLFVPLSEQPCAIALEPANSWTFVSASGRTCCSANEPSCSVAVQLAIIIIGQASTEQQVRPLGQSEDLAHLHSQQHLQHRHSTHRTTSDCFELSLSLSPSPLPSLSPPLSPSRSRLDLRPRTVTEQSSDSRELLTALVLLSAHQRKFQQS